MSQINNTNLNEENITSNTNEPSSNKKQKLNTKDEKSIDLELIKQRIQDKLNEIEFNLFTENFLF